MESGFIHVSCNGGFVARFSVKYVLNAVEIQSESGNFTSGTSKAILVPADATNIRVKVQIEYFIASWSTVGVYTFANPVKECYNVTGTTLNAHCKEVDCA
jgi:hypothetical protein